MSRTRFVVGGFKSVLRSYKVISDLRVNFHRSCLGVIAVEDNMVSRYARLMNCTTLKLPLKYLGLLIGGNARKEEFWRLELNKIKKKFSSWWQKKLSWGVEFAWLNLPCQQFLLFICPFLGFQRGWQNILLSCIIGSFGVAVRTNRV